MKDNKKEKLIPELRFPEFEGEWEKVEFNNYFKFLRSNSFSRNQLNYENGEVLNIHYGDIHSKFSSMFVASHEKVPFINGDVDLGKLKEKDYLKEGDLVIADASEDYKDIGKSIEIIDLSGKKVVAGLHTIPVRPEKDHALGFLGNLMKTYRVRHQIMRTANGISVLGISKTNIGNLKLLLPSADEQQKIASFLSLIDKKIELLKKKKELLELYKKGVMQKIFNREIRFKDKDGNDYPEWEEKRLGEVVKSISTRDHQIKTTEILDRGEFPVVDQSPDLISGFSNNEKKLFRDIPCIVFGDHTTVIKHVDFPFIVGADGTKILKNEDPEFIIKYLYYNLINNNISQEGYKRHWTLAKRIKLDKPPLEEQRKIGKFLTLLAKRERRNITFINSVSLFKKGLLQKMFI